MEGTPKPPPVAPRPPDRADEADGRLRRLQTWLAVVTALAVVAAGVAAYAVSEATKDQEEPDDTPIRTLRVDYRAFESEARGRLAQVEETLAEAPTAEDLADLRKEIESVDKRVADLSKEEQGADEDDLATRIDDLEQRIEDLEDDAQR